MSRGAASSWWDIDAWPLARKVTAIAVLVALVAALGFTNWRAEQARAEALASKPKPPSSDLLATVRANRPPLALWLGDSFTAGSGARTPDDGEACLASRDMGWACALDAQGGTGYINPGQANEGEKPLGGRLAATAKAYPDASVIVIDAGRNDRQYPLEQFIATAGRYYDRVEKAYPDAAVALIAPYFLDDPDPMKGMRDWMRGEARQRGWTFIDPLAEGWPSSLKGQTVDGVHPNPAAHAAIAKLLAKQLDRVDVPQRT